jgi:hypothetical protein
MFAYFRMNPAAGWASRLQKHNQFLILVGLFVLYFGAWLIANWPAAHRAWWYLDDFSRMEYLSDSIPIGLENGRPLEGIWFLTFALDSNGAAQFQNIILRLLQGGFHCLAASIAAYLLWEDTKLFASFFCFLPFVLWPFNAEAVLWRTAGGYPLAAFLSVLGVFLLSRHSQGGSIHKITGSVLIALAIFSNQIAATAGLVVWFLIVCARWLKERSPLEFMGRAELGYLVAGYFSGGLASTMMAKYFDTYTGRSSFAENIFKRLRYISDLNVRFFSWPEFYPAWLTWAHLILLLVALVLPLIIFLRSKKPVSTFLIFLDVLIAAFVIPYAPLLLLSESWPSFRIFYLAPMLLSLAWITIMQQKVNTSVRFAVAGIYAVILLGYFMIAWYNSAEYPKVFDADMGKLEELRKKADQNQISSIFVASSPEYPVANWNPYEIRYMHADSKLSAFLVYYPAGSFIRLFSTLHPISDTNVKEACYNICAIGLYDKNSDIDIVVDQSTICVCP